MTVYAMPMVVEADHIPGPSQGSWTYDDYAKIPDDGNRYEVIEGVLYMAPSPSVDHQASNGRFFHYLFVYVELKGLGRVFSAPLDVEFAPKVTVQPDAFVVLNEHKDYIGQNKILGAPDLIVEIASPGTTGYDRRTKQDRYEYYGVSEYWIADPIARTIEVLALENKVYKSLGVYGGQSQLLSRLLPDLPVKVEQFFV